MTGNIVEMSFSESLEGDKPREGMEPKSPRSIATVVYPSPPLCGRKCGWNRNSYWYIFKFHMFIYLNILNESFQSTRLVALALMMHFESHNRSWILFFSPCVYVHGLMSPKEPNWPTRGSTGRSWVRLFLEPQASALSTSLPFLSSKGRPPSIWSSWVQAVLCWLWNMTGKG